MNHYHKTSGDLTLVLLIPDIPVGNSVDPDQLALETKLPGFTLFVIENVNLCHQPGSSDLIS